MNRFNKRRVILDKQGAMELYFKGQTDSEIAKQLEVCRDTVVNWRKGMGLPQNSPKRKRVMTKLARDAVAANALGMTYGQYIAAGRPGSV